MCEFSSLVYRTIVESPSVRWDTETGRDNSKRESDRNEHAAFNRETLCSLRFRSKSLSLVQSGKSESGNSCFRTGVGIPLYNLSHRLSRKLHRDIHDKELFPPIFVSFRFKTVGGRGGDIIVYPLRKFVKVIPSAYLKILPPVPSSLESMHLLSTSNLSNSSRYRSRPSI